MLSEDKKLENLGEIPRVLLHPGSFLILDKTDDTLLCFLNYDTGLMRQGVGIARGKDELVFITKDLC